MATGMRKRVILPLGCGLLMMAGNLYADQDGSSESTDGHAQSTTEASAKPPVQGGYRAFVDADTGQLITPTPQQMREASTVSPAAKTGLRTDDRGLYEEASPSGGTIVNLQGRFRSNIYATVDESGEVTINHGAPDVSRDHPEHGKGE